jgi:hypothetical protein
MACCRQDREPQQKPGGPRGQTRMTPLRWADAACAGREDARVGRAAPLSTFGFRPSQEAEATRERQQLDAAALRERVLKVPPLNWDGAHIPLLPRLHQSWARMARGISAAFRAMQRCSTYWHCAEVSDCVRSVGLHRMHSAL